MKADAFSFRLRSNTSLRTPLIFVLAPQSKIVLSMILTGFALFLEACENTVNIAQAQNDMKMKGMLRSQTLAFFWD